MADLVIHDVDASLLEALERQAAAHNVSVEEETRRVLRLHVGSRKRTWDELIPEMDHLREELRQRYGTMPDSTLDVAEDRLR